MAIEQKRIDEFRRDAMVAIHALFPAEKMTAEDAIGTVQALLRCAAAMYTGLNNPGLPEPAAVDLISMRFDALAKCLNGGNDRN